MSEIVAGTIFKDLTAAQPTLALTDPKKSKTTINFHNAEFPEKLEFLFQPMRYKVPYGGRGAGKSWGIARALLLMGQMRTLRIVCGREIMDSIAGSVHTLLADQIHALGLDSFYDIGKAEITGLNGTSFTFVGLRHNINKIRSLEGVNIFWVEEAQTVSGASWDILIPTIRKEGSEIWISFNPELESDETYKRFVLNPPSDSIVVKIGWRDNPWFSPMMNKERLTKRRQDPDGYLTTWEGQTRKTLDGAVYAKEIRAAMLANRITRVPYDPSKPVSTFWDLGRADNTSIWFAQVVGFEFRIIDFYQNNQHFIDHYMKALQGVDEQGIKADGTRRSYTYLHHWIPPDGQAKTLGAKRTIEEQLRDNGFKVKIVAGESIANGINAARGIFPLCWFDAVNTADGMQCLERYQYEVDPETKEFSQNPLHNFWSHGADAFRYLALGLRDREKPAKKELVTPSLPGHAQGWMKS